MRPPYTCTYTLYAYSLYAESTVPVRGFCLYSGDPDLRRGLKAPLRKGMLSTQGDTPCTPSERTSSTTIPGRYDWIEFVGPDLRDFAVTK